jgi:hypothetical protein
MGSACIRRLRCALAVGRRDLSAILRRAPLAGAADRDKGRSHAVAEGDGAGFVQEQHVDVSCRLDGASGFGVDAATGEARLRRMLAVCAVSRIPNRNRRTTRSSARCGMPA